MEFDLQIGYVYFFYLIESPKSNIYRSGLSEQQNQGNGLLGQRSQVFDMCLNARIDFVILYRTKYGDECLNWRDPAILKKQDWEDGTYDHNYCRNPKRGPHRNFRPEEGVWCYTGLGNTKALCDVPWCHGQSLNNTVVEKESIPAIVTATIILGIASFFVTVVICLIAGSLCCCNKLEKSEDIELPKHSQQDSGFVSSAR